MKVISPKIKAASIAISKKLFDILQPDANFVTQIPNRHLSVQSAPHPYFIFEELPLRRIVCDLKERQMNLREPDKQLMEEYQNIFSMLIQQENPVLIYISLES